MNLVSIQADQRSRLGLIQAGRGVAALAVVFFHIETIVQAKGLPADVNVFKLGYRGVDFFFVLSGFIIAFAHSSDRVGWREVGRYLRKRAIRIYPLLWLVVGATLVANVIIDGEWRSREEIITSLTLWPSIAMPNPPVVWTLRHEMLFYLIFALGILLPAGGHIVFWAWMAACALQSLAILTGLGGLGGVASLAFSHLNLDFAWGVMAARAYRQWGAHARGHALVVSGLLAFILLAIAQYLSGGCGREILAYTDPDAMLWDFAFGLVFGVLVFGLATADRWVSTPRVLNVLGDASYALYLVHTPVMGLAARYIVPPLKSAPAGIVIAYAMLALVATAVGVLAHYLIERKAMALLSPRVRKEFISGKASAPVARDAHG